MRPTDGAAHKDVMLMDCELKSLDDQPGIFTGYASIFGKKDLQDDIVDSGAFARTIKQRGDTFPLLLQHYPEKVLGNVAVEEDAKGLKVTRGELVLDVPDAKAAYALMKRSMVKGMSIGFRTVKDLWDKTAGVRHLKEVDLWEVSIVTFPACPGAIIRTIKSGDAVSDITRALLLSAEASTDGLAHLSAAIFGVAVEAIPDEEMGFARGYAEELHRKSGIAAPWLGLGSLEVMVRSVVSIIPFARPECRKGLRERLDATLNPSEKSAFDWSLGDSAPDLNEFQDAISNLSKLAADIKNGC